MNEDDKVRADLAPLLARYQQMFRYLWFGLIGLLIMGLLLFFYVGQVKQSEDRAVTNTQALADQTKNSTICTTFPDDPLCVKGREIAADPTKTLSPEKGDKGDKGDEGSDGRGVTRFQQNNSGDLIVSYTDGETENVGRVVGKDGIDGIDGKDGRGILSTAIQSGSLIVNYTDGKSENLGIVVGPAGEPGQTGQQGVQGEKGDKGDKGDTGAAGISVTSVTLDPSNNVIVKYSDGRTEIAGQLIISTIKFMECNPETNVLTIGMTDGTLFSATVDCTPDNLPIPPTQTEPAPVTVP